MRLETHPGPQGQATFDWAVITRPLVVAEDPSPRRVVVYSPKPVLAALGGTAAPLAVRPAGEHRYAVEMPLPGAAILAFSLPEATAALPMDLRTAPRSAGLVFPDGMVTQPMAYSRPAAGEAAVGGVNKPALHAHPPQNGRLSVDYLVRLPQAPAHLEAFAGIRDTSLSAGVGFVVQVNGREVWSANMLPKQPWKPVSVDLSAYAGQVVLLSLVTDSLGGYDFDWAVWGEPKLVGK